MMLADAIDHVSPEFAWQWAIMAGVCIMVGLQIWDRVAPKRTELSQLPLSVREDREMATRKDVETLRSKLDTEIEGIHRKIGGSERGTRDHADKGISELRAKVDDLASATARVEQAADMHTTQLAGMDETLKEILRELPKR